MSNARYFVSWLLALGTAVACWVSPWLAGLAGVCLLLVVAVVEQLRPQWAAPVETASASAWQHVLLAGYVVAQGVLLAVGVWAAYRTSQQMSLSAASGVIKWSVATAAVMVSAIGVGIVTGGVGITYAHELGHSRVAALRLLGWLLMISVGYVHFMVEHYRGHHPRAATPDDPATARKGESLWHFLPRTLLGSLVSAWRLEAHLLTRQKRAWWQSALLWGTQTQLCLLTFVGLQVGVLAVLFWLTQSVVAVFLLETINYIEHYGLVRTLRADGRYEPFGVAHAWNADHYLTNAVLINLERHSDHHTHAAKPFAALENSTGPQLPTGYGSCIWLAMWPTKWRAAMDPRLPVITATP